MKHASEYLTKEDLQQFRPIILSDLRSFFTAEILPMLQAYVPGEKKQWLRTKEVVKMLGVSATTVQNMRISKTLKCTKVGGVIYYNIDDIDLLLRTGAIPGYRKNAQHEVETIMSKPNSCSKTKNEIT